MKRIAFIMHQFVGGGAEQVSIMLANELVQKGFQVTFLVQYDNGAIRSRLSDKCQVLSLFDKKHSALLFIAELKKHFLREDYDCVFSVSIGMSAYAVIANWRAKKAVSLIPVIHGAMCKKGYRVHIYLLSLRLFDKYTTHTITVSRALKDVYHSLNHIPTQKIRYIYNPIPSQLIWEQSKEKPDHPWIINKALPIILAVGRLCAAKNYFFMLEVFKDLLKCQQARLIVLGEGELLTELTQYASKLQISEFVDFCGFVNNPYPYYRFADCYFLSSYSEGLPTAMIEAMACGCPIVSIDCPTGPREILDDGCYGYLVPEGNKQTAVCSILQTLNGNHTPMELLKERAAYFSVDKAVLQYIQIIEEDSID